MKRALFYLICCCALFIFGLGACQEDLDPNQWDKKTYALTDFDRLDMGSAFSITVQAGPVLSVVAGGYRRNLDDLDLYVSIILRPNSPMTKIRAIYPFTC